MRRGLLLVSVLFLFTACASFNGEMAPLKVNFKTDAKHPFQRVPATLVIETPTVTDEDEDKDFTPIAETFRLSMQQRVSEFLFARNVFDRCETTPIDGAYRLSSKVTVNNYRPAKGMPLAIVGGVLLPPILGMAWSFPVGLGSCDYRVEWMLKSPTGKKLWSLEKPVGKGMGACVDDYFISHEFRRSFVEILPAMTEAARRAEARAAETRASTQPSAPVVTPEADKREVLAVFDVQDVVGQFKDKPQDLIQLTALLATAMTATGRFTVVPRDQLKSRLVDEKKSSYRKCYDEACQIELGKAVAAQKTLATQLLKMGDKCAVVANLYDLRSETTAAAAMIETNCSAGSLLAAMQEVAAKIAAGMK